MVSKKYPEPKRWFPKNPTKYVGDVNNIWVRSSWERKALDWMDMNPSIINYSSEEVKVPYISPIDKRKHNYHPDIIARVKKSDGSIVTYMIEIKPYEQTLEPTPKKRVTKRYINEVYTWGINSAKWQAAIKYCRDKGWVFKLLTEKDVSF